MGKFWTSLPADLFLGGLEEEETEVAQEVMNAILRSRTMSGFRPSKAAVEIMQHVLSLGLRCEAPTRAFFHFLLEKGEKGAEMESFDAARDVKAWEAIASFSRDEEGKKRYLHHMSAVMGEREKRDWDFLLNSEAWQNLSDSISRAAA